MEKEAAERVPPGLACRALWKVQALDPSASMRQIDHDSEAAADIILLHSCSTRRRLGMGPSRQSTSKSGSGADGGSGKKSLVPQRRYDGASPPARFSPVEGEPITSPSLTFNEDSRLSWLRPAQSPPVASMMRPRLASFASQRSCSTDGATSASSGVLRDEHGNVVRVVVGRAKGVLLGGSSMMESAQLPKLLDAFGGAAWAASLAGSFVSGGERGAVPPPLPPIRPRTTKSSSRSS